VRRASPACAPRDDGDGEGEPLTLRRPCHVRRAVLLRGVQQVLVLALLKVVVLHMPVRALICARCRDLDGTLQEPGARCGGDGESPPTELARSLAHRIEAHEELLHRGVGVSRHSAARRATRSVQRRAQRLKRALDAARRDHRRQWRRYRGVHARRPWRASRCERCHRVGRGHERRATRRLLQATRHFDPPLARRRGRAHDGNIGANVAYQIRCTLAQDALVNVEEHHGESYDEPYCRYRRSPHSECDQWWPRRGKARRFQRVGGCGLVPNALHRLRPPAALPFVERSGVTGPLDPCPCVGAPGPFAHAREIQLKNRASKRLSKRPSTVN
jgi:hypothetical protein